MKKFLLYTLSLVLATSIFHGCELPKGEEENKNTGSITIDGEGSFNIEAAYQEFVGYDIAKEKNRVDVFLTSPNAAELKLSFFFEEKNSTGLAYGDFSTTDSMLASITMVDSQKYDFASATATVELPNWTSPSHPCYIINFTGTTTHGKVVTTTYEGEIPSFIKGSIGTGYVAFSREGAREDGGGDVMHDVLYAWQHVELYTPVGCKLSLNMVVSGGRKVVITLVADDVHMSLWQEGGIIGQREGWPRTLTCKVYHNGAWENVPNGEMVLTRDADDTYHISLGGILDDESGLNISYYGTLVEGEDWEEE